MNTGLWICKLGPWCENICFHTIDWMVKDSLGKFKTRTVPEDWCFSWDAKRLGLDVRATRKVTLYHEEPWWRNDQPWGKWRRDEQYFHSLGSLPPVFNRPQIQPIVIDDSSRAIAEQFADIAWGNSP